MARRLSENADFLQNKAIFSEKAQFTGVNEHFEPNFNAVLEERCVFGQPPRRLSENSSFHQLCVHLSRGHRGKMVSKYSFTHVNCDFSTILYLKFDENVSSRTTF